MKFLTIDPSKKGKVFDWDGGAVIHLQLDKGQKIPPHQTKETTLVVIREGHVLFTIAGTTKELIPGTLLLMDPNEEHSLEAVEESSIFVIKMGSQTSRICIDN